MRISDWSSDVCSSDLCAAMLASGTQQCGFLWLHDHFANQLAGVQPGYVHGQGITFFQAQRGGVDDNVVARWIGRTDINTRLGMNVENTSLQVFCLGGGAVGDGQAADPILHQAKSYGIGDRKSTRLNSSH